MGVKSALPAIVVTPSSPNCSADFSIAFVAPPEKPSLRERLFSLTAPLNQGTRARTTLLLLLLLFIMACHLLTHRLATSHSHLQFGAMQGVPKEPPTRIHPGPPMPWFDWQGIWGIRSSDIDSKREFIVTEQLQI